MAQVGVDPASVDTLTLGLLVQEGVDVPRSRPPHPPEFKAEAVRFNRSRNSHKSSHRDAVIVIPSCLDLLVIHSDADLLGCVSKARESWNAARRRSTSLNTKDNGEKRWPWRCEVRPRIIINRVQRSPAPNLMSGPERDLSKSVQQQSNIELRTRNTRADSGLEDVFDGAQGDRLYPWPMLQTRLTSRLS